MLLNKHIHLAVILFILLFLLIPDLLKSQVSWIENEENAFYYGEHGVIDIEFDSSFFSIHFDNPSYYDDDIQDILDYFPDYSFYEESIDIYLPDSLLFPDFNTLWSDFDLPSAGATSIFPGMKVKGAPVQVNKKVLVKKNPEISLNDLVSGVKRFDTESDIDEELSEDVFTLSVENPVFSFALIQQLFDEGLILWGQPDFIVNISRFDIDPLYDQQFQLDNTGQILNGEQLLAGIDVNIEDAWNITKGTPQISVAIFDDGVVQHEDLSSIFHFDYLQPLQIEDESYHGMSCAGLIGASHNSKGIKGVAPGVQKYSNNIFLNGATVSELSKSFYELATSNISVVNNSWGFTSLNTETGERSLICDQDMFPGLSDAISYAANEGRNGLGISIIFSAGNVESQLLEQCVTYPANLPDVISVGAILPTGEHASYSPIDATLDFVVPSSAADGRFGVVSLDQMNDKGINSGNYNDNFGGTSAAAPIVTGIIALILSVDPTLTRVEIYDLLEETVTDVGAAGRDDFFGHGIPNAYQAVKDVYDNLESPYVACYDHLALGGSASSPLFVASVSLESSQVIDQIDVIYTAGETIELQPSFAVEIGNVFLASIEDCSN